MTTPTDLVRLPQSFPLPPPAEGRGQPPDGRALRAVPGGGARHASGGPIRAGRAGGRDHDRRHKLANTAEREKQIERAIANTAGMYGKVRGIPGSSMPPAPALELDAVAGRHEDVAADLVTG